MFAKIKFDKDVKPIEDHKINQISDALSLIVISGVDDSKF
jgi:hypothetical protein